jgi:hypothetical protein
MLKFIKIQDFHIKILHLQQDKVNDMIQQAVNFIFKGKLLTYNLN